jgi:mitogen-activated protein kinase 1/3
VGTQQEKSKNIQDIAMRRASSLKRGRIEGNDSYGNNDSCLSPVFDHDTKRVRRTISDERNDTLKKTERSISFEGIPLERSISVGTYERDVALSRKRRNSNFAIPEILAPWLKGQRKTSISIDNQATASTSLLDKTGEKDGSAPRLKVTNTRVRSISSFDLTKDEFFNTEKERGARDRVVSFGLVTAAEALGGTNVVDKKSSLKTSVMDVPKTQTLRRSFSAPVDHLQEQQQNKKTNTNNSDVKTKDGDTGRSITMVNDYPQEHRDNHNSMFSMGPSEALFNQIPPRTAYPTFSNTPVSESTAKTSTASHNVSDPKDKIIDNENNRNTKKDSYYTKPAECNVDKSTVYSRKNNTNTPTGERKVDNGNKRDVIDDSSNKKVETAEEKRKRLESSPSFEADIDMLGYDQFSDWHVGDRYKCEKVIGKGSYGSVCQAMDLDRLNVKVAIKRIDGLFDNMADAKRILREIRILRELRHENIIPIMDIIKPPNLSTYNELYIVFALRDTDLLKLIHDYSQVLSIDHVKFFMAQLLRGVQYMHNSHVIHRDLKPANILLTESCELSICDFGLARGIETDNYNNKIINGVSTSVNSSSSNNNNNSNNNSNNNNEQTKSPPQRRNSPPKYRRQMTQHVATRWYRAPELILKCDYNGSIDVWSAGCIFAEMLTMMTKDQSRDPLFPGGPCAFSPTSTNLNNMPQHQRLSQLDMIFDVIGTPSKATIYAMTGGHADNKLIREDLYQRNPIKPTLSLAQRFPEASVEAIDLLEKLLKFNPSERITINEAIEHPFLAAWHSKYTEELQKGKRADFSFETGANSVSTIRELITEEILWYEKTWFEEEQKQNRQGDNDG